MTERVIPTVWITKYALSTGIKTAERVNQSASHPGMVTYMNKSGYREAFHKPDWHETEDGAILRAEEMRHAKITSLQRQITKLQGLTFGGKA